MGFFKLGGMTLGSMFKKPATLQYPYETKPAPVGLKGHIVIDVDKCILCGMCMRNCCTNDIQVDRENRKWSVDPFQCIQCQYCVKICPKHALSMDTAYWKPATQKEREVFTIPEQKKDEKEPKSA